MPNRAMYEAYRRSVDSQQPASLLVVALIAAALTACLSAFLPQ